MENPSEGPLQEECKKATESLSSVRRQRKLLRLDARKIIWKVPVRDCKYEKVLDRIMNWDPLGLHIHVPFFMENIHIFCHIFKRV